jgi:hypothetical protein
VIRLFVGADGGNCDLESQAVLEYTVRKYASEPVEITWMQQSKKGPWSGWAGAASARTPFTNFRWSPPAVCNFEGRAIYVDSDWIFRADIAELWHQPIPGDVVMLLKEATGKLNTSCMLIDCAKAKPFFPELDVLRSMASPNEHMTHFFRGRKDLLAPFAGAWNCIDGGGFDDLNDPRLKAIHYSRIETQPQLRHAIPRLQAEGLEHWYKGEPQRHWREDLLDLFDAELQNATIAGYGIERYRVGKPVKAERKDFRYKQHKGAKVSA